MITAEHIRYQALADQNPGAVGVIGESVNRHGTPVSVLRCRDCGSVVSICPPVEADAWGDGCLRERCPSYNLDRDIDIFWDALSDNNMIHRQET